MCILPEATTTMDSTPGNAARLGKLRAISSFWRSVIFVEYDLAVVGFHIRSCICIWIKYLLIELKRIIVDSWYDVDIRKGSETAESVVNFCTFYYQSMLNFHVKPIKIVVFFLLNEYNYKNKYN